MSQPAILPGALVGRDRELGSLQEFFRQTAVSGGALFLSGDPGVGKTALLNVPYRTRESRTASAWSPSSSTDCATPPNFSGPPNPQVRGSASAEVLSFWRAPGQPQAVLAWEQTHLPRRFTPEDADFGPPSWDRTFSLSPVPHWQPALQITDSFIPQVLKLADLNRKVR